MGREFVNGYREINKNTIENKTPKDFSDDSLFSNLLIDSDIKLDKKKVIFYTIRLYISITNFCYQKPAIINNKFTIKKYI